MRRWSIKEIETLKEYYPILDNKEILEVFNNRKFPEIYIKAHRLGLKRTKETSIKIYQSSHDWKHERYVTSKGYVVIYKPDHPRANKNGRVLEHIVVWEQHNNKSVPKGYIIHHINENKSDNRIGNLQLMTAKEHRIYHNKKRVLSEETRKNISKSRIGKCTGNKNSRYKDIDALEMKKLVESGLKLKDVCEKFNISRTNYYKKLKKLITAT